jgi:hypothetical protein
VIPVGKIAIVSHDAGGAEIISSWIRKNYRDHVAVLDGQAKNIFHRKITTLSVGSLVDALNCCTWMLCGSGNTDFEYKAIFEAKRRGMYVVSFLDHWTSYRERFVKDGFENFPDEIWVGDEDALELVNKKIPHVKSHLVPNPYWMDMVEDYSKLKSTKVEEKILYVSTNIDFFHKVLNSTISDAWLLEKIIEFIQEKMVVHNKTSLTIRRHPSEKIDKYHSYCCQGLTVSCDSDNELSKSIAKHTHIIGFNSMAQVVGKLCGILSINIIIDGHVNNTIPSRYIDKTLRVGIPEMYQSQ